MRCVSPTPEYEAVDGVWAPCPTPDYLLAAGQDPARKLIDNGDLELKFIVSRRCIPIWMLFAPGSVYVKPLYRADDRPDRSCCVVTLELNTFRLSVPVTEFFSLLSESCRFELIVTGE